MQLTGLCNLLTGFRVFLSLRYGADLGRSRLVILIAYEHDYHVFSRRIFPQRKSPTITVTSFFRQITECIRSRHFLQKLL